jgi:hypothetical protein
MHIYGGLAAVPVNPARGKAQGRNDLKAAAGNVPGGALRHGPQTGVKAQKPTQLHARSAARLIALMFPSPQLIAPDENQSGRAIGETGTWANRSEMTGHPSREQACEGRFETPGAPHGEQREGPLVVPGREGPGR